MATGEAKKNGSMNSQSSAVSGTVSKNGLQERHVHHHQHQQERHADGPDHPAVGKHADGEDAVVLGAGGKRADEFRAAQGDEGDGLRRHQLIRIALQGQVEDGKNGQRVDHADDTDADRHVPVDDRLLSAIAAGAS